MRGFEKEVIPMKRTFLLLSISLWASFISPPVSAEESVENIIAPGTKIRVTREDTQVEVHFVSIDSVLRNPA